MHGNRRVVRQEKNEQITVLAVKYEDKRLNSPNDLVYKSGGSLYFTDPPFDLPKFFDGPRRELPFSGYFACRRRGKMCDFSPRTRRAIYMCPVQEEPGYFPRRKTSGHHQRSRASAVRSELRLPFDMIRSIQSATREDYLG
jgi:hypothetical protein